MDPSQLVTFIRQRGLAVIATRGAEIIFDTSMRSRKYRNIQDCPRVAVVIGWDDEVTVQCEGTADILTGSDRERCLSAYVEQYPEGRQRAQDPDIAHIRVRPGWLRHSDYRPDSFDIHETRLKA